MGTLGGKGLSTQNYLNHPIASLGSRDGQNHHMLMILKSNHLNKGDLKSKSKIILEVVI